VAFGSDWPVSSADPLQELHVAVNRVLSAHLGTPGHGRDDRAAAARGGDRGGRRGRCLHQGRRLREPRRGRGRARWSQAKIADFAVLDQDLYVISAGAIGDTLGRALDDR